MGGTNVKNTIVERYLEVIAPHYCCSCGKVGTLLCAYCKYNIGHEPFLGCFVCGRPSREGICQWHENPIERSFIVTEREGALEAAIDSLKFHHLKAAARTLAELLDEGLPFLPENTVIVPIPTVRSHIRQRGYDQVELIARHFAQLRGLPIKKLLIRRGNKTQHTLDREQRQEAAKEAFELNTTVYDTLNGAPVLLLDDIITTGATITQAATALRALESPIWAAAVAYQPLD